MTDTKPMRWEEMVNKYPEQWVAIKDAVMDGPDVVSGVVIAVLSDDEIIEYENTHGDDGIEYRRTTEGNWGGIIESNLIIELN